MQHALARLRACARLKAAATGDVVRRRPWRRACVIPGARARAAGGGRASTAWGVGDARARCSGLLGLEEAEVSTDLTSLIAKDLGGWTGMRAGGRAGGTGGSHRG